LLILGHSSGHCIGDIFHSNSTLAAPFHGPLIVAIQELSTHLILTPSDTTSNASFGGIKPARLSGYHCSISRESRRIRKEGGSARINRLSISRPIMSPDGPPSMLISTQALNVDYLGGNLGDLR
tara:strand:+ start:1070 stop:1441 length:372 start_codon:yes stop_codon:yes gene_type:complete